MSVFNPAYHLPVKLQKYNGKVSVCQANSHLDASKVLRAANPAWSAAEHQDLAELHAAESESQDLAWRVLLNEAALETFGRPFQVQDYKISAIGCDKFSEENKVAIRFAAHAAGSHETVSRAHAFAAKSMLRAVAQ